ncbi:hypothetical protein UT300018_31770 [Clostridium faecium]
MIIHLITDIGIWIEEMLKLKEKNLLLDKRVILNLWITLNNSQCTDILIIKRELRRKLFFK